MWTCSKCGEVHEGQFSSCWKCEAGEGSSRVDGEGGTATAVQPAKATVQLMPGAVTVINFGPASQARYAEAYATTRTFSTIGKAVKVIGLLVCLLGLMGLISASGNSNEYGSGGDPMAMAAAFFTLFTGALVALMGIFMAAHAQLQMSSLDCAVHTSPFLTDIQRAEAMRLRLA